MTRRILAHWFTGCLLAVTAASAARAQMLDAFVDPTESDMQLFAPVEFDFEGLPVNESSGWIFKYDRLNWASTGERAVLGGEGLTDLSEEIVRVNPNSELPDQIPAGQEPVPYVIQNGIQDAGPDANFAWGDRYEFGYFKGGNGWLLSVLDGPKSVTNKVYGFPELVIGTDLPISQYFPGPGFGDPNLNYTNLQVTGAVLSGQGGITTTQHGFGSVHVNFETPQGYLWGWRDYYVNQNPLLTGSAPTTGGPSYVITQINRPGGAGLITVITIARGADGNIDNLDGDNIAGFDPVLGIITDFGDLHRFNVRFDQLSVRNTTESDGVELMRTHVLDNNHLPVKEQRNHFTIAYGARFLAINDNFHWEGLGDIFGRSYVGTDVENQIVGPQIRAMWTHQRGRLGFDFDGRCLFGYNVQDLNQTGGIGENLNPGGVNAPLYAQPTYFSYGRQENFFSPVAEMRAEASYRLTSAFALKLGYTGIFADNITRASQIVRYRLPDMGFREDQFGKQTIFINGLNFGVEAVY